MTPLEFATRLRKLRREMGLTQRDVAEILGVAKGTVAAWEQGIQEPPGVPEVWLEFLERHTREE